jgi:hypothetical protein
MSTPETRDALKFTRMCKFWHSRRCHMGNECTFAHTSAELRDAPSLVRTELCYQFRSKGQCSKGAACTFAHGKEELRLPVEGKKEPVPQRSEMDPIVDSVGMTAHLQDLQTLRGLGNLPMHLSFQHATRGPPRLNMVHNAMASSMGSIQFPGSPDLESGSTSVSSIARRSEAFWL